MTRVIPMVRAAVTVASACILARAAVEADSHLDARVQPSVACQEDGHASCALAGDSQSRHTMALLQRAVKRSDLSAMPKHHPEEEATNKEVSARKASDKATDKEVSAKEESAEEASAEEASAEGASDEASDKAKEKQHDPKDPPSERGVIQSLLASLALGAVDGDYFRQAVDSYAKKKQSPDKSSNPLNEMLADLTNAREQDSSHAIPELSLFSGTTTNYSRVATFLGTSAAAISALNSNEAAKLKRYVKVAMYNNMLNMLSDMDLGPGTSVALDEAGYQEVAELKDPQQMEFFVRRLISQLGLRVLDQGGLHGTIPYYDGEQATQTFAALHDELHKIGHGKEGWVTDQVSGASAPLSQDGYAHVAILANNREMAEFVRRVVSDLGLSVDDEYGLMGVVPYHSGEKQTQTFSDLQGELVNASKINGSWVTRSKPCPNTGHPSDQELEEIQGNSSWAEGSDGLDGDEKNQSLSAKKKSSSNSSSALKEVSAAAEAKEHPKPKNKTAAARKRAVSQDTKGAVSHDLEQSKNEESEIEAATGDRNGDESSSDDSKPSRTQESKSNATADIFGDILEQPQSQESNDTASPDRLTAADTTWQMKVKAAADKQPTKSQSESKTAEAAYRRVQAEVEAAAAKTAKLHRVGQNVGDESKATAEAKEDASWWTKSFGGIEEQAQSQEESTDTASPDEPQTKVEAPADKQLTKSQSRSKSEAAFAKTAKAHVGQKVNNYIEQAHANAFDSEPGPDGVADETARQSWSKAAAEESSSADLEQARSEESESDAAADRKGNAESWSKAAAEESSSADLEQARSEESESNAAADRKGNESNAEDSEDSLHQASESKGAAEGNENKTFGDLSEQSHAPESKETASTDRLQPKAEAAADKQLKKSQSQSKSEAAATKTVKAASQSHVEEVNKYLEQWGSPAGRGKVGNTSSFDDLEQSQPQEFESEAAPDENANESRSDNLEWSQDADKKGDKRSSHMFEQSQPQESKEMATATKSEAAADKQLPKGPGSEQEEELQLAKRELQLKLAKRTLQLAKLPKGTGSDQEEELQLAKRELQLKLAKRKLQLAKKRLEQTTGRSQSDSEASTDKTAKQVVSDDLEHSQAKGSDSKAEADNVADEAARDDFQRAQSEGTESKPGTGKKENKSGVDDWEQSQPQESGSEAAADSKGSQSSSDNLEQPQSQSQKPGSKDADEKGDESSSHIFEQSQPPESTGTAPKTTSNATADKPLSKEEPFPLLDQELAKRKLQLAKRKLQQTRGQSQSDGEAAANKTAKQAVSDQSGQSQANNFNSGAEAEAHFDADETDRAKSESEAAVGKDTKEAVQSKQALKIAKLLARKQALMAEQTHIAQASKRSLELGSKPEGASSENSKHLQMKQPQSHNAPDKAGKKRGSSGATEIISK